MKIWNKIITLLMSVVLICAIIPGRDTKADDASFWDSLSSRYYYSRLDSDEQALYNALSMKCSQLLNGTESNPNLKIDVSDLAFTADHIADVIDYFESDNPQYFFMTPSFSYYKSTKSGKVMAITNYIYDDFANGSTRSSMKTQFKNAITSWTSEISKKAPSLADADIEKTVHEYICSKTVYELNSTYDQSPVSTIVYGKTVCAGYSKAFALFMHYYGIECVTVASDNHMWNVVNIHGYWYCVDTTNDDSGSSAHYVLFNTTYQNLYNYASDYRTISDRTKKIMPATDYDNSYLIKQTGSAYFSYNGSIYFLIDLNHLLCKKVTSGGDNPNEIPLGDGTYLKVMNAPIPAPVSTGNAKDDIRAFVNRLYTEVLGREAEEDGAQYWTDRLYKFDISGAEVAFGFIFSDEYTKKNVSDRMFIATLYRAFFNREFDDAGMEYWDSQLYKGMSRMDVAKGFIYSQEWSNICAQYGIISGGTTKPTVTIAPTSDTYSFVERLYTTALGRTYDADGRNYWADRLANFDLTGEGAGVSFFLSPEFTQMNLSNDEFVERLYKTFMDRDSDADGKAYWIGRLNQGASRSEVVYGFTRSAEFVNRCIDARIKPY